MKKTFITFFILGFIASISTTMIMSYVIEKNYIGKDSIIPLAFMFGALLEYMIFSLYLLKLFLKGKEPGPINVFLLICYGLTSMLMNTFISDMNFLVINTTLTMIALIFFTVSIVSLNRMNRTEYLQVY